MKVFKAKKSKEKKTYIFAFEIDDEKYTISFEGKKSTFIYDVILETGKKIIDIKRKINQNNVDYHEKMNFFIKALKKDGEENKLDNLFKETIDLYSKKKGFGFLISIFLKIYKTKKDLCSDLLVKFRDMNKNKKDNDKNMDRKPYLNEYKCEFNEIKTEADKLIATNSYDSILFYGIILCYLNFYDYESFSSIINELLSKKPTDLYEILIIYNAHLKNPINQSLNFYNEFIKYTILSKEFSTFEIGLNYLEDIETFINVIEKNKEEIYDKLIKNDNTHKNIIKLDSNLKFRTKNREEVKESDKKITTIEEEDKQPENVIVLQSDKENNNKKKDNVKKSVKDCKDENDLKIKNKKENKIIFEIIN